MLLSMPNETLVRIAKGCDLIGMCNLSVTCRAFHDLLYYNKGFSIEISPYTSRIRPCKEFLLTDGFVPLVLDRRTSILPKDDGQVPSASTPMQRTIWHVVRKNKAPKATCLHCGWTGDIKLLFDRERSEITKWNNHAKMEVERQSGKYCEFLHCCLRWKARFLLTQFMADGVEKGWYMKAPHRGEAAT